MLYLREGEVGRDGGKKLTLFQATRMSLVPSGAGTGKGNRGQRPLLRGVAVTSSSYGDRSWKPLLHIFGSEKMDMHIKKSAILAPGGSEEMAVAAFEAGADMVYMGPQGWSRRTRAFEVDDETVRRVAQYAREKGKILKLAFNTLPSSDEIPVGVEAIGKFVKMGVNHFIMTDPGFVHQVKDRFPETKITASVGCSVMNLQEFRYYQKIGFDIMVAPSEMTLEELRDIRKNFDGGIEILIHANRDYTYLGRCTMSSYFRFKHSVDEKGKDNFFGSPNRGGLCYRVCKSHWKGGGSCLHFSNKDLGNSCYLSLDEIPEYMKTGIDVLKIQGREYSPSLVGKIVTFYRELVDACYENPDAVKDPSWRERILQLERDRDAERNRRTGALLEECTGKGETVFARLDSCEKAWV